MREKPVAKPSQDSQNGDFSWALLGPMLWTGIFLVVAEVCLEYRASTRGWNTAIFSTARSSTPESAEIRNEYGPTPEFPFRSPILQPANSSGRLRIWVASASHAADSRMPPDRIFPSILRESLAAAGTDTDVLNGSVAGARIRDNLELFEAHQKKWRPHLVVLYQMSSNITSFGREVKRSASPASHLSKSGGISRTLEHATVYTLLRTNLTTRVNSQRVLEQDLQVKSYDAFSEEVNGFIDMVERVGSIPVLCTFAMSHDEHNVETMPSEYRLLLLRQTPTFSHKAWIAGVRRMNNQIRDIGKQRNVAVIDLAKRVGGVPKYFRDPVHFSNDGHEAVGIALAMELALILRDETGSRQ